MELQLPPKGHPIEVSSKVNSEHVCSICNVTLKNQFTHVWGTGFGVKLQTLNENHVMVLHVIQYPIPVSITTDGINLRVYSYS